MEKTRKPPAKPVKVAAPIAFTYEEALEIARANGQRAEAASALANGKSARVEAARRAEAHATRSEARVLGAASLADILGYNPKKGQVPEDPDHRKVPEKFQRYYRLLLDLRAHIVEGLSRHTEDTLMKSAKEDSGDLSGYSQHMADAGTESFDRDFALSLVANEQEALSEIDKAIKRIHDGTYGICELTQKPITRERLVAVPFARYSVESQAEVEKLKKMRAARAGGLAEFEEAEAAGGDDEPGGDD